MVCPAKLFPPPRTALASPKPTPVLWICAASAATAEAWEEVIPLPVQAPLAKPVLIHVAICESGDEPE